MASVAPPLVTPANDRIVLYNVDWETYANLRRNLGDKPTRLTYSGPKGRGLVLWSSPCIK